MTQSVENHPQRLELARMERHCHGLIAVIVGAAVGWTAFALMSVLFRSLDETLAIAASLIICVIIALFLGAQSLSVVLELSAPPVLVKTRLWFGRYKRESRLALKDIAWVRVVYADEGMLSVEAGTRGHETTSMVCIPSCDENIPTAERLCSEIAAALHVENKGLLPWYL